MLRALNAVCTECCVQEGETWLQNGNLGLQSTNGALAF